MQSCQPSAGPPALLQRLSPRRLRAGAFFYAPTNPSSAAQRPNPAQKALVFLGRYLTSEIVDLRRGRLCDYEATVEAAERAIRSFPDFPSPYRWLAAALGELGRTAEAKQVLY